MMMMMTITLSDIVSRKALTALSSRAVNGHQMYLILAVRIERSWVPAVPLLLNDHR